jgi:hypothetical protein
MIARIFERNSILADLSVPLLANEYLGQQLEELYYLFGMIPVWS